MSCINNMAALVFILYELFPLDGFSCYFCVRSIMSEQIRLHA